MALDRTERYKYDYRHPEFTDRLLHWEFLKNSYEGGIAYKKENYLTRYVIEEDKEYRKRVEQTPFDNHCKSIVSIYNSFLFRKPPHREFGTYTNDPTLQSFLKDADREGRSLDEFMSQVNIISSVYGHAWVIVDKPDVSLDTRAQEIENDVRPYVTLFSPLQVLDWDYKQNLNGTYYLDYLKLWEYGDADSYTIKYFYRDRIVREHIEKNEIVAVEEYPNNLGEIFAVCVYSQRSMTRGVGVSDIADIADVQRAIFDANSEIEQIVRLSNHPTLVMVRGTSAGAGAGAIINIEENLDSGLKPYLLQPSAASIDSVRNTIADRVDTINRMANVGAVRQIETKKISGIALAQEFELLNARLAEKANNLELAEQQIWTLYAKWLDIPTDFATIEYPNSFNTRDKQGDFALLKEAKELAENTPTLYKEVCHQMATIFVDDSEKLKQIQKEVDEYLAKEEVEYSNPTDMASHIMIDPATGETREVSSEEEHTTLMNQGWTHPEDNS